MNIVSPRVKELRESQSLTQEELTARCNLIGWGTLAKIEAQVRSVTDEEIPLLAQALKVSISQLYK